MRVTYVRALLLVFIPAALSVSEAAAQTAPVCRMLCAREFKVERTLTFTNLFDKASPWSFSVVVGIPVAPF